MRRSRVFRITKGDLEEMVDKYKKSDVETHNLTSVLLEQYLQKSLKTGVLQITRVALLREAIWARKNGMEEWCSIVSKWADLADYGLKTRHL